MFDSLLSRAVQKNETANCAATVSSQHFYRSNKTKPFWSRRGVGIPLKKKKTFTRQRKGGGARSLSFPASGNKFSFHSALYDDLDGVDMVQIKLNGDDFSRVRLKQDFFNCVIHHKVYV